jgi:NADH dehydrogenase
LIHVSALGASLTGPSAYLRSKAAGEKAVQDVFEHWPDGHYTILRPSVVFGKDDQFMNMFATLAKWFPALPLAGSQARLQPVFVEDVAQAIVNALQNTDCYGHTYDLAGPCVYTLGELVSLAALWSGHPRSIIPMPFFIGQLQAFFFECLPGAPLMSRDNLDSLTVDNVSAIGLDPILNVVPTPLESIAPNYLR